MHKAIHAQEDKDAARQKASLVAQKLKAPLHQNLWAKSGSGSSPSW